MRQLGLEPERNLIQTKECVPVTVHVVGHKEKISTLALYITRELSKLFISRETGVGTGHTRAPT